MNRIMMRFIIFAGFFLEITSFFLTGVAFSIRQNSWVLFLILGVIIAVIVGEYIGKEAVDDFKHKQEVKNGKEKTGS